MKTTSKPDRAFYQYDDYREYLRDVLARKRMTYARLSKNHSDIVGVDTIKRLLAKQKRRGDFRRSCSISNERLADLLSALRIPEQEASYVLLLKLENDAATEPGGCKGRFGRLAKQWVDASRTEITDHSVAKNKPNAGKNLTLLEIVQQLNQKSQSAFADRALPILVNIIERDLDKPGYARLLKTTFELMKHK